MRGWLLAVAVLVAVTLTGTMIDGWPGDARDATTGTGSEKAPGVSRAELAQAPAARSVAAAAALPLRGVVIALDPGHQLGNHRFPRQTNAPVQAGGFTKPCNTTGTATTGGIAESTVNFQLAQAISSRLRALGATVRMTRTSDSDSLWGPCVNTRGRFGQRVGARLMVSLHADGAPSSAHGFHVIRPTRRAPWTTDIARPSRRLARALRDSLTSAGVPRSSYLGGGTGLVARSDLGTLNMSDVPAAMIEIGNMKNAADARRMTTTNGRATYAAAIVRGIRTTLQR